ncbi:hypothetical protein [Candidatus Symbiobacter mobilis]|nr:hypothetical protein [Candidatus Symbiobacter mobilis]
MAHNLAHTLAPFRAHQGNTGMDIDAAALPQAASARSDSIPIK